MAGNTSNVRTLHVAMKILNEMSRINSPSRVSTLARTLDMTPPRVSRHLSTLRQLGLVDKSGYDESYILGRGLITLGQVAMQQNTPVLAAERHLERLREVTGGAVVLAMKSIGEVTAVLSLDSPGSPVSIHVPPGQVFGGLQSPTLRVFLAFGPDEELEEYLDQFRKSGAKSSRADIARFRRQIQQVQDNRYDFQDDAHGYGHSGLCAPVLNHLGAFVAAVTLILPSNLMESPPREDYLAAVRKAAANISAALGYVE